MVNGSCSTSRSSLTWGSSLTSGGGLDLGWSRLTRATRFARLALVFQLCVRAAAAVRSVVLQLAVRASVAVRAVVLHLAMPTQLLSVLHHSRSSASSELRAHPHLRSGACSARRGGFGKTFFSDPDEFSSALPRRSCSLSATKRRTTTGAMGHEEVGLEDASDADVEAKRAQMMVRPGLSLPRARPAAPSTPISRGSTTRTGRHLLSTSRSRSPSTLVSRLPSPPRATGPATRQRGVPSRGPRGSSRGGERRGGPARERAIVPRAVREGSRCGGNETGRRAREARDRSAIPDGLERRPG